MENRKVRRKEERLDKSVLYASKRKRLMRVRTLPQKWTIVVMIALALLPALLVVPARAEMVNITVTKDSVAIGMNIILRENLTSLPLLDAHLSLANSTTVVQSLIQPITNAIRKTAPSATISSLTLQAKTFNNTGMWTLEENYSIMISNASTDSGSNIRADLGFISLNLTQSLHLGQTELNAIGATILLPALQTKEATYPNLQYFIDGSQTRNAVIPEQTTKTFWLLDFTWIPRISTWTENNDVLAQTTSWSFNPPSPRYNLTLGRPSPEGPLLAKYTAIYQPSIRVTVPSNAWMNGNVLYFDTPTSSEAAMPLIATTSLILGLATFVVDRRVRGPFRARKKKSSKPR